MTSIEDQTNQLFSSLLLSSRELRSINYDGEAFVLGTGPIRKTNDGETTIALLDENQNILGLGHPLTIKNLLLAALEGGGYATKEEVDICTLEIEKVLSEYLPGIKCYLGRTNGLQVFDIGRSVDFFSSQTLDLLRNNKDIYSTNLLPVPLTLSLTDHLSAPEALFLSRSDIRQINGFIKLIKLGQIYGKGGALSKKQSLLKKFFSNISSDATIDGLIVRISQGLCGEKVIGSSKDNTLYFPFLFDEESLKVIGDLIGK